MNVKKTFYSLVLVMSCFAVKAQDIHYSMFQMSPVGLNPALAGAFSGTARIGGIYRAQDIIGSGSETSANIGYKTYSFFIDVPVIRGFRAQDWIGIGLGLNSDVAGIGDLTETATIQAISYHLPIDKNNNNVISIGVNSGTLSYKGKNNYTFEDELFGGGSSSLDDNFFEIQSSGGGNKGSRANKADWGFGLTYKGKLDNVSAMRLGVSSAHLNNPTKQLTKAGQKSASERLPVRITAFAEYDRLLSPRTRIIPALLYQNYRSNNELALQALFAYYMDPKNDITVYAGLGLRVNTLNPIDAVPIYLGFDIKDVKARLAFDTTISRKSYTNRGFGALEFSVNYILKVYKRPKIDPAIFCPRF